jgi:hypothetical protein
MFWGWQAEVAEVDVGVATTFCADARSELLRNDMSMVAQ